MNGPPVHHELHPTGVKGRKSLGSVYKQAEPLTLVLDVRRARYGIIVGLDAQRLDPDTPGEREPVLVREEFRGAVRRSIAAHARLEADEELVVAVVGCRAHVHRRLHPNEILEPLVEDDGRVDEELAVHDRHLGHDGPADDEDLRLAARAAEHVDVRLVRVGIRHEEVRAAVEHARRVGGELHAARRRPVRRLRPYRLQEARRTVEQQLHLGVLHLNVGERLHALRLERTFERVVRQCAVDQSSHRVASGRLLEPEYPERREGERGQRSDEHQLKSFWRMLQSVVPLERPDGIHLVLDRLIVGVQHDHVRPVDLDADELVPVMRVRVVEHDRFQDLFCIAEIESEPLGQLVEARTLQDGQQPELAPLLVVASEQDGRTARLDAARLLQRLEQLLAVVPHHEGLARARDGVVVLEERQRAPGLHQRAVIVVHDPRREDEPVLPRPVRGESVEDFRPTETRLHLSGQRLINAR